MAWGGVWSTTPTRGRGIGMSQSGATTAEPPAPVTIVDPVPYEQRRWTNLQGQRVTFGADTFAVCQLAPPDTGQVFVIERALVHLVDADGTAELDVIVGAPTNRLGLVDGVTPGAGQAFVVMTDPQPIIVPERQPLTFVWRLPLDPTDDASRLTAHLQYVATEG